MERGTRLLTRRDVAALLPLADCITAVEAAFAAQARGQMLDSGVLGIRSNGGGFHIKATGQLGARPYFVTKVNANFGENEQLHDMPRIQGVLVLCHALHGYPLAVMDATLITALRTAAATGVATRHLARPDASVVTIAGCGRQSRLQLRAVAAERRISRAFAFDQVQGRAQAFAGEMSRALGVAVDVVDELGVASRQSDIVITCTSATAAILHRGDVAPGTFIAAVGADHENKQEIEPALLAASAVVPDLVAQAATMGDLHHALDAGVMRRQDVRAELGAVVAGIAPGRLREDEVVVFDSTGAALQDVAAAGLVYERALQAGQGVALDIIGEERTPLTWPTPRISL